MNANPYRIEPPALISFSGGRTSAYMLYQVLQAYDGQLPDGIEVTFANTGKEREETLRFVHECSSQWGVKVHWLEWRSTPERFEEVGYNSASRAGEPFEALIAKKKFLPNAVTRYCTQALKIETMKYYMLSLGHERWANAVGLRYDEGMRVMKQLARNDQGKERWTSVMPMSKAKVTKRGHILPFWLGENTDPINLTHPLPQGFDLGLRDYEGNCDLCFLKSIGAKKRLLRDHAGMADWWMRQEATVKATATPDGARFVTEYRVADLEQEVRSQPYMPGLMDDEPIEEYDAECGLTCVGD